MPGVQVARPAKVRRDVTAVLCALAGFCSARGLGISAAAWEILCKAEASARG